MKRICVDAAQVVPWVAEQLGIAPEGWQHPQGIGLLDGEALIAGVVYERISACDCNVHIAALPGGRWLRRDFLAAMFRYPFVQLGLQRITGLVPASNQAALRFDLHLGFVVEGICREAMPGDDVVLLRMLRRECRFIE